MGRGKFEVMRVFLLAEVKKSLGNRMRWDLEGWRRMHIAQGIFPGG